MRDSGIHSICHAPWLLEVNRSSNIPIVVSALGTTPKRLEKNLKRAGTTEGIKLLQKVALLGTARIPALRKVQIHDSVTKKVNVKVARLRVVSHDKNIPASINRLWKSGNNDNKWSK